MRLLGFYYANQDLEYILGCFKIAPLSNFLTAQQISDGVLAADYEFDIIFYL